MTSSSSTRGYNPTLLNEMDNWGYLRGTRTEVEMIGDCLKGEYDVSLYMGEEGVEESFKALSGRGVDVSSAFKSAQNSIRACRITRNNEVIDCSEPHYWASFVLIDP